ncbi:unnamed protein product, partial [Rotaria sp. Silwood1]
MIGFELQNGKFQIKAGIRFDVDAFIEALRNVNDKLLQPMSADHQSDDLTISQEFLAKHPLLKTLIKFYVTKDNNDNDSSLSFLTVLIDNIIQNLTLPKNAYRYNEQVQKFPMTLFILAGRNAYEFVRMNIPGAIPAVSTIQSSLDREESQIMEGEFRFDTLKHKFSSNDISIAFCAEDCTPVIPTVTYNVTSNTFFLNRAQKLSILHAIKSESEVNSSVVNSASLVFPKYRKESSKLTSSATVSTTCLLTKNDIQRIVSSAFHDVFELLSTLDVDNALKENNIHTLKNLSSFILNEMNAMTNTIDDSTPEDTESDSESDAIFDYHDSINEEGNETDNDYDSTIYELNDVTGDIFPG